ncbi:MAG: TlyA family RNA methyltransferase [Candidatus Aureabacteria bacterium]|nr:TlyA family RNA methyltransferase [Candidatus Auribacterota bacterium]
MNKKKIRLDQKVVESQLADSREQARRLILAGQISCGSQVLSKPGMLVNSDTPLKLKNPEKYVSRGGLKLEGFFLDFPLNVKNALCLDIGSSTGGFTDCLLQTGVKRVVCVDVGQGILHWKLRTDPRITVHEKINARYLTRETVGNDFDLAVIDVSFISLKLILPPVFPLIRKDGHLLCLVKPQFEAGRKHVLKGGVVRSELIQKECVDNIIAFGQTLGLTLYHFAPCRLKGPSGNQEYFVLFGKG